MNSCRIILPWSKAMRIIAPGFPRTPFLTVLALFTALTACGGHIFDGDGSDESGFVPPPPRKETPPPPANMAGGETLIPYPPPPATPMSRSEKKNPPTPPIHRICPQPTGQSPTSRTLPSKPSGGRCPI